MPEKPQRRALGEWAVENLYERIFTGDLPPGADLGEELLCEMLDVSRATVSFALRQLEQEGLATVAAGNGRRQVAAFSIGDVSDLYDVRAVLEAHAVSRAAAGAGEPLLSELRGLQEEMEAISRKPDRPTTRDFGVDFEFHRAIARASGSKRALAALRPIWNQTHALLRHLYSVGAYADATEDRAAYSDHHAILDALAARDPDAAALAMRTHLSGRRDRLLASLRARGGLV
jgi:DNA-binding GntR family transcriptional regulator